MKSYEQIARLLYETYEKKYAFAQSIIAWYELSDRAQQSWVAAAKAAHKEILGDAQMDNTDPETHDLKDRGAILEQYVKFNPRILEMDQQPEAIKTASKLKLAVTCGFIGSAAQYQHLLLSASSQLLGLHARVEELESVDANHIAQDRKMVAQEPFGYFKRDSYGWMDCSKDTEGAVALYEAPQPQADLIAMQQCVSCGHMYHAPAPSRCDCLENEEGKYLDFVAIPAPQPQADALDAVNLDRLGKALTKLGHATWVSQEEAAADIPRWINALTSCVLEIPEAAPQPQADGRDAAWSDLKIAFDIPDGEDETLWKCVESGAITLPNGWKLIETTGAGGVGPVAVFRTEHLPTSSETFVVGSAINYAIATAKEMK